MNGVIDEIKRCIKQLEISGNNTKWQVKNRLQNLVDTYQKSVAINYDVLKPNTLELMEAEYKRIKLFKEECDACVPNEVIEAYENMLEVLSVINRWR